LDRGVDLPDEQCRVVIIAKVPYPYLGDRQVNARLHSKGGQVWYNVQTVRSIVQMTGRGVRHEDDWCVSYIIDSQFNNLWSRGRGLFPLWWKEAMEWKRA
jgi:Rad3-related DNA helicase